MITNDKITEIFYIADEFCKEFYKVVEEQSLPSNTSKKRRNKPCKLSDSEIITILILFHLKNYRNLKHFYIYYVQVHLKDYFPKTVSYNRFVELQQKCVLPLVLFLKTCCLGECTGISIIDSTTIKVCKNNRINAHKVFKNIAQRGKSSMGWFYGFKLHIIVNDKGEILNFMITTGNVDDREPLKNNKFTQDIFGKLLADRGYISKELFNMLFVDGLHLMAKLKNNMKGRIISVSDSILMRKRALIETINDELKNICQIEHSRHRSFTNFITNLISGLVAYSFLPKKPRIRYEKEETKQLALF